MHRVRYYSRLIEPSYFKGKGVRGWWIRTLNRFRFWVESKVCYHVAKVLAKEDGYQKPEVDRIMRSFKQDLREERELLHQDPVPTTTRVDEPPPAAPPPARKLGSRKNTEEALARMMAPPRVKRYVRGNASFVAEPEGDFDEVAFGADDDLPTMEVDYARGDTPKTTPSAPPG